METPVEIRYAGVVVARANEVRRMTVGGVDLFLAMPEPLPAGTVVALGTDQQARIEKVIESPDPSVAGVYVKLLSDGEASLPWVPAFREDEVPAPRPPAVVVSPVIVRPVHAPAPPRVSVPTPREVAVEPPRRAPDPEPIQETPLPVVMASVVEEPARPFVASMPRASEQVESFDPVEPPPAVIEHALKNDRRRSTIVVAVAPPAEEQRPAGAVVRAVGEIDTGSRKINDAPARGATAPGQDRQTIVVQADEPLDEAPVPAAASSQADEESARVDPTRGTTEIRLEDLPPARALPPARGRATKRRRTTQR